MRNFTKRALLLALLVLCLFGISVLAAGAEANEYDSDAAAVEAGAVVRIGATEGEGAFYYSTVAEAIGAAQNGDTVYLLSNATLSTACTLTDKVVAIEGATDGLTLTGSAQITLGANAGISFENLSLVHGTTNFILPKGANTSIELTNVAVTNDSSSERMLIYADGSAVSVSKLNVTNCTVTGKTVLIKAINSAVIGSAASPAVLTDNTYPYMVFYIYTATAYVDVYGGAYSQYFAYGGDNTAGTFVCKVNPTGDKTTTFDVPYIYQHGPASSQKATASLYFRNTTITQTTDASKRPLFNNKNAYCDYTVEFAENVSCTTLYGYFNTTAGSALTFKLKTDIADVSAGFKAKATLGTSASYYTNVTKAISEAADGTTVTLLADAAINTSSIKDRAITIVGAEKYTLSATSQSSHIFNLTGETASLTLENLVVDVANTGKNTNAYMFGTDGTTTGTYTITLTNVDTKWLAGSGAIYGYASTKATITLTDCSFDGGVAIINTKSANAANVTMYLDNVTCAGDVVAVNSGAADRVAVVTNSTALNFASDAEAIAAGVFFRFADAEGGKVYAATLADAIEAAANGGTVYVLANATVDAGVSLAAKAVTVTSAGSAAVTLTNASSGYLFSASNGATLTLANINVATNGALVTAVGATTTVVLESGATVTGAFSASPFVTITGDFGKFEMKSGSKFEATSAPVAPSFINVTSGATSDITLNGEIIIGTASNKMSLTASGTLISAPDAVSVTIGGNVSMYFDGQSAALLKTGRPTASGKGTLVKFTATVNFHVTGYTAKDAYVSMVYDNAGSYGINVTIENATLNMSHVGATSTAGAYSAMFYMYRSDTSFVVKNSSITIGTAGQDFAFMYTHGGTSAKIKLDVYGGTAFDIQANGSNSNIIRDKGAVVTFTADSTGTPSIKGAAGNLFQGSTTLTLNDVVIASTKLGGTISSATNVYYATDAIAQSFGYVYRLNEQTLGGTGAYASAMTGYYKTLDEAKALGVNGDTVYDLANDTEIKIEIGSGTNFADDAAAIAGGAFFRIGATEGGAVYFTTLADAIEAAKTGDTIYVLANATVTDGVTVAAKALTITSAGSTAVTLTNGGSGYLFVATGTAELTITNINVSTNGAFVDASGLTGTVTVGNGTTVSGAASANAFFKVTSAATGTIALANGSTLKVTSAPTAVVLFSISANLGKIDVDGNIVVGTESEPLALTAASYLFDVSGAATVTADLGGDIDVYVTTQKITFWQGGASTINVTGTFDFHVAGFDGMIQCFKDRPDHLGGGDKAITVNLTGATVAMTHEISATGNNAAYSGLFYIYVAATTINVTDSNVTIGAAGQGFPFMLASGSNSSLNILGNSVITINCDQTAKSTNRIVAGSPVTVTVSANTNGTPVLVGASNGSLFSGNTNVTLNAAIIARGTSIGGTIAKATNLYFATDALAKANGYAYRLNAQTFGGEGAYASAMTGYYKTLDEAKAAGQIGDKITDLATNEEIEIKPAPPASFDNDAAAIADGAFFRVGATQGGALGTVYFTSLEDAIAAAADGDTIYVLASVSNVPATSYITKTLTFEGVNENIEMTTAAKAILFNIGHNGHVTVKNLKITSDNFVVFRKNSDGAATASITLESGAIVTNIDLAAYNDILIYNSAGANAQLTVNIKAGASLITKSLTEVAPTYATIYSGTGKSITVNVWGTLKNLAKTPDGKNAQVFTAKGSTNNATLNVYEGAVIEGTSDSESYSGNYSGIVYFSEATNVINIYGGTITINGNTGFAYAGTKATINITGGTINNTDAAYAMFFGGTKTVTVSAAATINNNGKALANSATYSFENDATALKYGMTVRLGDTEGGMVYYTTLTAALNAAPADNGNGGETTVLVLANTTHTNVGSDGGAGTYFNAKFRKKVHITSKGTTPFTVTTTGTINFYVSDGCVLKFTNITFNLDNRLARVDGSCSFIFGEGCTMNSKNTIFIYDNGNNLKNDHTTDAPSYTDNLSYTIDVQKGAVINSTGAIATALVYRGSSTTTATITLKIAGKINMTSSKPIFYDNGKAVTTLYYDATTADVTCPATVWFSNTFRQVGSSGGQIGVYAKGFASTAEAAKWGYDTSGTLTGMTYNADPAAEWNYTFITYGQFTHSQYKVLNANGGEIWQLRTNSSIYQTASLKDLGTVTFKSYNGAIIKLQGDANRLQAHRTTIILDGITLQTAGSIISICGGTEEAPSALKLINGAKIVGTATQGSGKPIVRFLDSNCNYASLYVDKTSEITLNAALDAGNALVIYTDASWANGSIVIEGKLNTTGATCKDSTLIAISGAANGCSIVLDGATLAHSESATGTKKNLSVTANTYNGSVELKNGVTTDLVYGIVASDSTGKLFGSITGAVNFAPVGTPVTITLSQAATFASGLTIENKFITIVGLDATIGDDTYDLKYTGSGGYAFTMVNLGSLTFQNVNFYAGRPLMLYKSTALDGVDQANKDLTLSLVNSYIKVVGSSRFIASSNNGSDNTQCDTLTINVDETSTMYYESTSSDRRSMFEFYHSSHKYIVVNIDGTISFKDHVTSDNAAWFLVSNNPSAATITFSETAQLNIDVADATASDRLFYFTTGTNQLTLHENAITDDQGKLTLGGLMLFRQYSASASPAVTIVAANANNQATLLGLVAEDNNSSTFSPISWLTVKEGVYYYGSFNAVLAAAEDKGTVTLLQNSSVFSSALLSGKEVTITAVENAVLTNATTTNFVQMGSNTVLNVTNFKYQGNAFLVFTNPNGAATLNLNDGAIIEGGDPTANFMITTASDAKGAVTLNIGEKAQLIRPASYTITEESTKEILYFRNNAQCNVTLNIYGKFANLTTVDGALNATLLDHCLKNATCTINIYDGAEIEGTSASTAYSGQYQGLFYCAPNGSNINYTYFNIYGGKITSHGCNPLAYFDTNYANVRIEGAPEITLSNLEYGVFWFNKNTNTSLSIGLEDDAVLNTNGKEYYCGNKPVIYAVSGITDEQAIVAGMLFRYNGVYYKTLADAIALIPEGSSGEIYLLAPATFNSAITITNKHVKVIGFDKTVNDGNYDLQYTGTSGYAFTMENYGSLVFENVCYYGARPFLQYKSTACDVAQADKDLTISLINSYVCGGNGSSRFITSVNNGTAADKTACDTLTITVDANSIIEYQPISTDERNMFNFNNNSHPYVNLTIEGKVIVKDRAEGTNPFVFIVANNPSVLNVNITETASLSFDIPDKVATDRFLWNTTAKAYITIHENAIVKDGALTIAGLQISRHTAGMMPYFTIVANDTTNEALFLGLTGYTGSATTTLYNLVSFKGVGEDTVYYGNMRGTFYTAQDGDTITMIANTTLDVGVTLTGKAVTLTAVEGLVLTNNASHALGEGGKLTLKDITIVTSVNFVGASYKNTAVTLEGVTITASGASMNFINVNSGAETSIVIKDIVYTTVEPTPDNDTTKTNSTRLVCVGTTGKLVSMSISDSTISGACIVYVGGALTSVAGSAENPIEITNVTMPSGTPLYAYTGTIYANIYGGTFAGALLYGGDDKTNVLDIKINPTGDLITTFTRVDTSNSVYSAWVHLHPAAGDVQNISFLLRNVTYTDTGAAPLFAIRDAANVSISVENSTFELSGAKLSGFSSAYGATFNSDATARLFGYGARLGAEGESKYYADLLYALTDVADGGTIYVVGNIKQTSEITISKAITIMSPEGGEKYTVTTSGNVPFFMASGANVTFKNINYTLGVRLARFDGNATMTFGDGANFTHSANIFIYNNGNCIEKPAYTIDIQKGAVITSTGELSHALIYNNDAKAVGSSITVKIAGTVITNNGSLVKDVDVAKGTSAYRVYVDAASAVINTGTASWAFNNGPDVAFFYNGTFETEAELLEWAYNTGAYGLTINNDPAAEYKYSLSYHPQFAHVQYNVLNTNGGTIWQLRSAVSIYQTAQPYNRGTITFKSYNGATITFQDSAFRLRVQNTTIILDGIEFLSNGACIGIHGGSEAAPSVLKLINGAKITANVTKSATLIQFQSDNGGKYASIYVDETSSITQSGTTTSTSYIIYAPTSWIDGSVTIKGTLTTTVSGANVYVLGLNGGGTNAISLDGATLVNKGTATGTAALVYIMSGCHAVYEEINNTTLTLEPVSAATSKVMIVDGAISFKGLTSDEAFAKAMAMGMTVRSGDVYSQVLSTGIVNAIPVGGKGDIYILAPSKVTSTVVIKHRDVTIIGKKDAAYDLTYTLTSGYMFQVDSIGTVTFKDLTITAERPLLQYFASEYADVAQADKDIVINFVNTKVDVTGSSVFIGSGGHHGNVASKKCDSVTVNIDKDSVLNYTAVSTGEVYCIAFNHNTHPTVALNVYGTLNFATSAATNTYVYLVRSNNPSTTKILFAEGAHVKATINSTISGGAYVTSCTGGSSTTNSLTMYLDAITENGALTLGDLKLYSGYTSSCVFTVMVVADNNSLASTLMAWAARNSNTGGSGGAYDEYPLSASLALDGEYYFSSLGGVIGKIPEGSTATISISSNMTSGGTIVINNKTITLEGVGATKPTLTLTGNPAFQLGDNSHLIFKNLDIIATSNFILTNGTDTKATTKIDIESGVTIDVRHYNGAYFFRAGSVGILTMNIKAGSSVKLLTDGTVRDGAVQGMFDFTSYSNAVAEGSVINVAGQIIYGLKFKGEVAGNSRSAMFKIGDKTIDVIFTETADLQLLHQNAIGGTWNAIVCLDSSSAKTIVTFNGCKITLGDECAIYGLNGTNYPGTYEINGITLESTGSFLVSDYAAAGGVNSTVINFRNFDLNGNALTQNDKLPYMLLANIGFASEDDAFAQAAYFTLTPGTYSNLGGAIEAAEDGAVILVNKDLVLSSATLVGKTLTFKGATDGITITNKSSGYLFTIGSNAHLIFENLTYEGNFFAQFNAAAGTTSSLYLGENAHIIGGDNVADAYILYCSALKGTAEITISKDASVIRPAVTLSGASSPYIYRFGSYGHVVLNVHGQLKNLTKVDAGQNATIGYANIVGVKLNENDPYNTGMILNIYPGAEVEGTCDSAQYNGYYQGEFYFAVNGNNHHELNIYGGSIVSHGINSLAYFGNNQVTVRIEGTPYISMPDANYNMICLHNTKSAADSQTEFYADVEEGAVINLNGKAFFWASSPEVSLIKAGKFFTDDNAASFGVGYRVIDENGTSWYVASLGVAATLSRNGGTIYLVGDVTDYGSSTVLDKYLFLEAVKPGYTITLNGSTLFTISSGTKDSPVRMYIKDIVIKGSSSGVLFSLTGNANGIFVLDNCSMNGTAGVIKLSGAATASVTLNKGNYTVKNSPFYGSEYSTLTLYANDITFVATGSGNTNSLFHLTNNATGHFNIKGGSATTSFHTFYTMDTSIIYVDIENFSIVTNQWALASQSSTTWYANLTNVNLHAKNTTATRVYATKGSYFNIMGGTISTGKKDTTNPAVMTFGNSITVNVFDAYINSPYMSAISGLASTVNITIYGGTYIYSGTEATYAPIMLPKQGNLTVKGGTFINTSGAGPVFSNTAYSANVLTLEAYNAISNSSNLILNFAATGTPTAALGAYGRLTLNTLMMTRGARPNTTLGTATAGAMTFKSTLSASAVEYLQNLAVGSELKFGMLVVPTELLASGVDFTHAGLANYSSVFGDKYQLGVDYFDYEATFADIQIEDDGCYTIELTHSGIAEENFNTKYSVVFYAKYEVMAEAGTDANGYPIYAQVGTDANGNAVYSSTVYRYADYEEGENARSLAEVAYAAYNDPTNTSDKDILSAWCNGETEQKTIDIFLVAGGSNAVGNTPYSAKYAESLINHQCASCGHIADSALFADAKYTCVNKLVHGKALTLEDGEYVCDCGYKCAEADAPADLKCPATHTCGAAKATFQNVLKTPITNVFYSGIVSERAPQNYTSSIAYATASKYTAIGSAPTLGLGWSADTIGPEYGMATELANHYNAESGKYAAIMKYAFNDATLATEDAYYGTFADELYNNFMQMVTDQIAVYANLGYKVNVAGLYWMQGEADTANASAYAEALQKLVANVRADLSQITGDDLTEMPVVVGEIATFTGTAGNADRVALKNAQNSVTGVLIDQTSLYMADNDGIFLDAQNVVDTGARVAATIMAATDGNVVIPEIENTTEILDSDGNPIPGMEGHTSLAMSLIAAPSGATITLTADQTVYTSMSVTNRDDIVINGSGNVITVVADAPAIALQNASVTLENIVIEHTGNSAAITLDNASTLMVEDGTKVTAERTAIELTGNASSLVINGGTFETTATDATDADAIIRTTTANITITGGTFTAADGASILSIDKNASHKLIVNITGGTFVAEDRVTQKVDADGHFVEGEYDIYESIAFVNNCPTAILVIDPLVLAAHPELSVYNVAAQ